METPKGFFSWLLSALVFIPPAKSEIIRIFRNTIRAMLNFTGKVLSMLL